MQHEGPVVLNEGGLGTIKHGESVFGWFGPLDIVHAVRAVIVAGDDDRTD